MSADLPEVFTEGTADKVREKARTGKWVLVAVTDGSDAADALADRLSDEFLADALENFRCFRLDAGSADAESLGLEHPVGLSIFVSEEEPDYVYDFEEPEYIFTEDLAQFLDDAASDIIYGDELDL